jgi:hypothetical protein
MLENVCQPAKLRAQYLARVRGDAMNYKTIWSSLMWTQERGFMQLLPSP